MKKWAFQLNAGNIALILFGTGVNLLGGWAAQALSLPFWLDSVGTFLSAVLLGPLAGALSGGLMNVISSFFYPGDLWFAVVSVGGGVAVGLLFPRGRKVTLFSVIAIAQLAGLVMTILSTPLNLWFNGGYIGNPWGDALVDMLAPYINSVPVRCVAGGLLVNMPDKAISIVIAMSILYLIQRRRGKAAPEESQTAEAGGRGTRTLALFLLGALLAAPLSAPARAADDFAAEYAAEIYDKSDGLIATEINAIAQTPDGYVWSGGYSGLYRYNGYRFEKMRPVERLGNAMCLCEDGGALWVGTNDSGLARYLPDTGETAFFTAADGLAADSIRSLCPDGAGGVYVGTAAGLSRVDAEGVIHGFPGYPQLSGVKSLACLGEDRIAGVTARGLLFLLFDGKLVYSAEHSRRDLAYTALSHDGGSALLVGTSGSEVDVFRIGKDGGLKLINSSSVAFLSDMERIVYAPEAAGYFVSAATGFAFLDKQLRAQDLARDEFSVGGSDAMVDYQGNVWLCSTKQGVMKLSPDPFVDVFRKAGMEPAVANALLLSDGKLYIGTDSGLAVVGAESCKPLPNAVPELFEGERIRHLMQDSRGNIWVSSYGKSGLVCLAPDGSATVFNEENSAVLGSRFRFAAELSDGTILAASTEGLNLIRGGQVVDAVDETDGLRLPKILCALECADGTVLAGSDGDGVYRLRDGKVIGRIGSEEGLPSLVIMRIIPCERGYIYVTSNALCYQGADVANDAVRTLRSFPYNNNYDVFLAEDGKAWVSSSAGVYVADAQRIVQDGGYRYVLLDHSRGFDTTLTSNAQNASNGELLYLCCSDGVRRINTRTFNDGNDNYSIVMSSLTVEGEPVEYRDGTYHLPAGRGRLQLRPAVLNYAISNPLVSIRLEGSDDPGIILRQSEMTSEYYMTLPYGDFRVHIQILDDLTGAVRKEAFFSLHKDAELYEQTYYKLYLLFVGMMLVAFLAWTIAKMGNMAIIHRQYEQIKEAKEEAEQANHAKSSFLASMSHEIRTPINAVLGMDEMILRESSEPEIRGYASDIYTAGNTLLSLINDILDSSKIESGKMEIVPVDYELGTLVHDLYNMVSQRAQAKDLRLELAVDPALPRGLHGDDVRVRQAVTNILTNAVKYTPAGTVWFRVSGHADGEDVLLHFEVEDTGVGIKEEDLPRLFEAYRRIDEGRNRHIEGTGLGMTITTRLLNLMGSRLEVESTYGKGSKFFFDLRQRVTDPTPLGEFSVGAREAESHRRSGSFIAPDAHVLLVDDNVMNLRVFKSLLKTTQIRVSEAESGAAALELARAERFDMVFMDHMMPDMDGVETMRRMREIDGYDAVPIFVLTANAVTGAREQYLEDGFDGFLSKPIVSERLEQALRETLPPELVLPWAPLEGEGASAPATPAVAPEDLPSVDGLDWNYAWMHLPGRELLEPTVREFRALLAPQADKLEAMWRAVNAAPGDSEALAAYRIQAHGMKSAAATIGIVPLAGMAKMLEFAARDGDTETMARLHGVFLAEWRSYGEKLRGVFDAEETAEADDAREQADADMLRAMLSMLQTALEDFDVDAADGIVGQLRSYRLAPEAEALLPELAAAVADLDEDAARDIAERMLRADDRT